MAKECIHRHPVALEIVDRAREDYFEIKKIIYRDELTVGYVLDENNQKDCDQTADVSFYYFDVDWKLTAKKARLLLDVIHGRIRHQYYELNQILWWNINYWAFYKTLHIYATMTKVNKEHIVKVLKHHQIEKLDPFFEVLKRKPTTKKPLVKAILYCLNTLCEPRRNPFDQLVIGQWS